MDPSGKTFWIRACFVNQDQDCLVLVLVTRKNWQPSRRTTLTQHWFNVNSTNWIRADNHSPERGLIEGPTFLSYEFQQVLIQWDWKVLRKCGSRGGTGGPDPPGKSQVIWVSIAIGPPPPWKKLDPPPPPGKCWTPSGTLNNDRFLWNWPFDVCKISWGLKKTNKKNVVWAFFCQTDLTPPPPPPPTKIPGSAHVALLLFFLCFSCPFSSFFSQWSSLRLFFIFFFFLPGSSGAQGLALTPTAK